MIGDKVGLHECVREGKREGWGEGVGWAWDPRALGSPGGEGLGRGLGGVGGMWRGGGWPWPMVPIALSWTLLRSLLPYT